MSNLFNSQSLIYRSSSPNINPDVLPPLVAIRDTLFLDSNPLPANSYYVIRAQDIHDNLSPGNNEAAITISGIDELNSNMPTDYALYQNHPNPFNSSTTIHYAIPTTSYITLKIFNLLGKEIATLVNGKQSAGKYEVQWNSVDLPSGVYVYRLEAGDFVATKKLILMK